MLSTDLSKFDHNATSYSPRNALILAEASRLTYEPEETIKRVVENVWKTPNVKYVSKTDKDKLIFSFSIDTQAFVAGNDQLIILAFRGTEPDNIKDWKTNFKFFKHSVNLANSTRKVHVHKGFWHALDLAWGEIMEHIRTFRNQEQPIWLTGHSLGGALATLAAFRLTQEGLPFQGLYTFGQPRVGVWNFSKVFNQSHRHKVVRFVNNNDFVTFVPPFLFGYAHIEQLYYLTADHRIVTEGLTFRKAVWDRIVGLKNWRKLDHNLGTYIKIIKKKYSPISPKKNELKIGKRAIAMNYAIVI